MKRFSASRSQSGSALFLILIAIALFAALTYAVMQGSRSSAGMLSDDKARLGAQEIIAYGNVIATTVQKLRLSGCTEAQMDYSNSLWILKNGTAIQGANGSAPADGSCAVFGVNAGQATPVLAPTTGVYAKPPCCTVAATDVNPGSFAITTTAAKDVGTVAADVVLQLQWVERNTCIKINDITGATNDAASPPGTGTARLPSGQTAWCSESATAGNYHFFKVLLAK